MDAVTVTDLVVERGHRKVLPGLSFTVSAGQVTGLLGPSGSGKTTLMRTIVGVQQVRSGEVTVLGLPAGSPGLRSRVGYVTQAPSVYADLTVRDNVRYFAALYGMSWREADAAIADVGLTDAASQLVDDLSGGQRGPAPLAAGEVVHELGRRVGQPHVGDRGVGLAPAHPVQGREVADVVPHGQVGVDARRLRDVADPAAQARRARGQAEHGDLAGADLLHADDRAHEGGLPAAAGPEQPGHLSRGDGEAQAGEHLAVPAFDDEVGDGDGVHGVLRNSTTDELNAR